MRHPSAARVFRLRAFHAGLTVLALVLAVVVPASRALAQSAPAGAPPVIDRELFFGDPEISGAQISPDGKYIAFIKPFKGTRNIWVKTAAEPFDKAKPITADTKRPVRQYFWSRDAKYVLFVQDQGGDENFNVYAVDPAAAPAAGAEVPTARNLTEAKGVRAEIFQVSKVDPDIMFVGLNDRDAAWHDAYRLRISTGERTLVRKNTDRIAGWEFDLKDQLRLALRTTDKGETEVLRVDENAFTKIYECGVFETCGTVRFHKDGQRVYMQTNKGDSDLTRLTLFDVASGKEEVVESDPEGPRRFREPDFSDVTDELIGTTYNDERVRIGVARQGVRGRLQVAAGQAAERRRQPRVVHARRAEVDRQREERRRSRDDLPLRPQGEDADAAVQDLRQAPARGARADEGHRLQVE